VAFDQLKKFITEDMQMQHIHQPVMLIELLKNGGQATEEEIASGCNPTFESRGLQIKSTKKRLKWRHQMLNSIHYPAGPVLDRSARHPPVHLITINDEY